MELYYMFDHEIKLRPIGRMNMSSRQFSLDETNLHDLDLMENEFEDEDQELENDEFEDENSDDSIPVPENEECEHCDNMAEYEAEGLFLCDSCYSDYCDGFVRD